MFSKANCIHLKETTADFDLISAFHQEYCSSEWWELFSTPWTCRTVVCGPPVWPEKVRGVLQMKCQAYLFFRQFRVCIWQKKTAVFLRIPLACSVGPNDHLPMHGFLLLANGPYNSLSLPSLPNVRNGPPIVAHLANIKKSSPLSWSTIESAASWESTSRAARRKLTLKDVKNLMRDLTCPTASALTEIMNEQ